MQNSTCSIDGCNKPVTARGWCPTHYKRWTRHGGPAPERKPTRTPNGPEQFWAQVVKTDYCWNWTGYRNSGGYGVIQVDGKTFMAHKLSYEWLVGDIPQGLEIDHECHNEACVKPEHLRVATRKQNAENHSGAQRNSTSGIRGVSWDKRKRAWRADVRHHGATVFCRYFHAIEEAEAAVIAKRNELFTHNDLDRATG